MRRYRFLFLLLFVDALLVVAHIFLRKQLGFFDLDKERSLKAVFSGFQLFVSGGVAALIAYLFQEKGKRWLWGLTSVAFVYLALDDMMVIHERIGFVLNRWTGLTGYRGESFNWLIYFIPFIALGIIVFFLLLRTVWQSDRRCGMLLGCGVDFLIASLIFEVLGGKILGSSWYPWSIVAEEAAQLVGESFILVAVLFFLQKQFHQHYQRII